MKIAFIADVHLANHRRHGGSVEAGVNRRCRQILDVLNAAADRAVKEECDALVVAGDLYDNVKPEPQIVKEAQDALERHQNFATIVLSGNHDIESASPGDHALGPLEPVCYVYDQPASCTVGDGELWLVPYKTGVAADWLPKALSSLAEAQGTRQRGSPASRARVLVLHLGLTDSDTPPWLKDAPDAVPAEFLRDLCAKYDIQAAFAGHWHPHRVWSGPPFVCQIGALCPTGFRDLGLDYGTLAIWDSGKGFERIALPGPRFLKDPSTLEVHKAARAGNRLYLQLTAFDSEGRQEHEKVLRAYEGPGAIVAGEVVMDDVEATTAARSAAYAARSAETLDEALDGFVREMELDEALVERKDVLERSKRYLARNS